MLIKSITNLRVGGRATGSPSDGEKCTPFYSAKKECHRKEAAKGERE